MVREGGVEPPHQRYWYLKPARLPIPPPSHEIKIKEQPPHRHSEQHSVPRDAARTMPMPSGKINALSTSNNKSPILEHYIHCLALTLHGEIVASIDIPQGLWSASVCLHAETRHHTNAIPKNAMLPDAIRLAMLETHLLAKL